MRASILDTSANAANELCNKVEGPMGEIILLAGPNNYLLLRQKSSFAVEFAIHKVSLIFVAAGEYKSSFA